jgi:hypothetical protein
MPRDAYTERASIILRLPNDVSGRYKENHSPVIVNPNRVPGGIRNEEARAKESRRIIGITDHRRGIVDLLQRLQPFSSLRFEHLLSLLDYTASKEPT